VVVQYAHLVWGYCASERILSTRSQASGFSLNCCIVSGSSYRADERAPEPQNLAYLVQRRLSLFLLQRRCR
jgi:hypothetical protein